MIAEKKKSGYRNYAFLNPEFLVFLFALCCRIYFSFVYPPGGTDHEMQHVAAGNLLQNGVLGFTISDITDLSVHTYSLMNQWPPLTALLLSLFASLTGSAILTDQLLMLTGLLALLFTLRGLINRLELQTSTKIILWSILAVNPDPFFSLGISDLWSSVFFLLSTYYCIPLILEDKVSFKKVILVSTVFFLPAAFRYQYYPLIFFFPAMLLIHAFNTKRKDHLQTAILSFVCVGFLLTIQFFILYANAGAGVYISEDAKGFYPENSIKLYAFIIKGFLPLTYLENHLITYSITYLFVYKALLWLLTIGILVYSLLYLKRSFKSFKKNHSKTEWTLLSLFLSAVLVFLLLLSLSLRFHAQGDSWHSFTYISEGRYYLPVTLSFLLLLAKMVERIAGFKKITILTITVILSFNYLLWIKFNYNTITGQLPKTRQMWNDERITITNTVKKIIDSTGLQVTAVGNKDFLYLPVYNNYSVVPQKEWLKPDNLQTSKPVVFLYITKEVLSGKDSFFINQSKAKLLYKGFTSQLYSVLIEPKK